MLYAIMYDKKQAMTDADLRDLRRRFVNWTPPPGLEIKCHYAFVQFGGVLIVDAVDNTVLRMAMHPFIGAVDFEVQPVLRVTEALAISLDVDERLDSAPREAG